MFLRIFRYRVKPQMRDRHLALQARSAQLYGKYVTQTPKYFRKSGDAHSWVELHWYADKAECQKVAQTVAEDLELARLWREFQETLDPDQPPTLEEFGEYELPRPVNASPFSQPPLEDQTPPPALAAIVTPELKPIAPAIAEESPAKPAPVLLPDYAKHSDESAHHEPAHHESVHHESGSNGDGRGHADDHAAKEESALAYDNGRDSEEPEHRPAWPSPPIPVEAERDEIVIVDEPARQPPATTLSFNDGVWIVEPEPKRRGDNNG
jgi:hypothetical protein